jgi:hypothetical protein
MHEERKKIELGESTVAKAVAMALQAVQDRVDKGMPMGSVDDLVITVDGRPNLIVVVGRGRAVVEWLRENVEVVRFKLQEREGRICAYCGCAEDVACQGGCAWHAKEVCSHPDCVREYEAEQREAAARAQGRTS